MHIEAANSFEHYLEPLRAAKVEALLQAWPGLADKLMNMAQQHPAALAAGLEMRLDDDPQLDIALRYAAFHRDLTMPAYLTELLPGHFMSHWYDHQSPLHQTLSNLWLEYDQFNSTQSSNTAPALFMTGMAAMSHNPVSLYQWLRDWPLARLRQADYLQTERANFFEQQNTLLRTSLQQLPAHARLAVLGVMLSRPAQNLRLIVEGLDADSASDYCEALGLHETQTPLKRVYDQFADLPVKSRLCIDLTDCIEPVLALELIPTDHLQLENIVQRLAALVTFNKDKQDMLLSFRAGMAELANQEFAGFVAGLYHFKLTVSPSGPGRGKAYLYMGRNQVPTSSARVAMAG